MRQTTGMTELEGVVAVATHRSFRAAAVELGLSPSALSHAIAGLEQRLGVRLFHRTTRSVSLTEAGTHFLARVRPALQEIAGAMRAVDDFRATPRGRLRINASRGAARWALLAPVLEFLRRYPEVQVDLVTEDRLIDIVAEGFDAGVREVDLVAPDMVAVPFGGPVRFAVVGSPAYFARHPRPKLPADLLQHDCIRLRMASGVVYRWEFERRGEALALDVKGRLTLGDDELRRQAALEGAGLAFLSEWSVAADLAAGRLVRVLDDWTPPYPGLCLYYPAARHVPANLRAFLKVLREGEKKGGRRRKS
ncbi:LysR family transcriptional regulator [Nannocystis pusilla]|uniref:LysR family transcriptional regulator n=1 Tax=Nannocystis pusilla TaxID=889268 RepID=UPI003BF3C10C